MLKTQMEINEEMKAPQITKNEFLEAIRDGMKDAILTMTETGDGYTGPICFEPFMDHIRQGVQDAVAEILMKNDICSQKESFIDLFQNLCDQIENLSSQVDELGTEIYKYRQEHK